MEIRNVCTRNLFEKVMGSSEGTSWQAAVLEWEIVDYMEDESLSNNIIRSARWMLSENRPLPLTSFPFLQLKQ